MNVKKIFIFSLLSATIVALSSHIGMFWDNVLFASKMGTAIYDNGITSWKIPKEFDPGQPPFLATIMAIGWTLFGRSLEVSHWILLPFVFGLLWQLQLFVNFFIKENVLRIAAFILVLLDPTLLSQLVLVNPEVIQLFFFFLALNAMFKGNNFLKILALSFLGIVTFRGMMLCFGLFLIEFAYHVFIQKESVRKQLQYQQLLPYVIASIPAIAYITWRIFSVGWLYTYPGSPWESLGKLVTVKGFIYNVIVLAQRYLDFGRIGVFFIILIGFIFLRNNQEKKNIRLLLIIAFLSTSLIVFVSLIITNKMGHRYFISSYLSFALLSFIILKNWKAKWLIYFGLCLCLILGNFIVYPDRFAQGWGASLAHLPYWNLRHQAIDYMDMEQIPIEKTASFFPNQTTIDEVDLNGDMREFVPFTGNEEFVFYSNVYNLSDNEFDLLAANYRKIYTLKKHRVRVELFEKVK